MVLDISDVFGRWQENFGKVGAIKWNGSCPGYLRFFLGNWSKVEFSDLTHAESSFVIGLILSFVGGDLSCHEQCAGWIIFAEF